MLDISPDFAANYKPIELPGVPRKQQANGCQYHHRQMPRSQVFGRNSSVAQHRQVSPRTGSTLPYNILITANMIPDQRTHRRLPTYHHDHPTLP